MEMNLFFPGEADRVRGRSLSSSRIEVGQGLVAAFVTFISGFEVLWDWCVHCRIPSLVETSLTYCVTVGHFSLLSTLAFHTTPAFSKHLVGKTS